MLFSRRVQPSWTEQLRLTIWPRHSWTRSARYIAHRMRRMRGQPKHLALGAAAGVFVAVLPIPGLQLLSAALLSWLVGGHSGAAVLATFAANPVTYPLIWLSSYVLGATMMGTPVVDAAHDLDLLADMFASALQPQPGQRWSSAVPMLKTLLVGAMPLAMASAFVAYVAVRRLLKRRAAVAVLAAEQRSRRSVPRGRVSAQRPRQQRFRAAA